MKKTVAFLMLASCVSCYGEWDVPRTPRRDPCTRVVETAYAYVQPACPNIISRNPRDLDGEAHGSLNTK